MHPELPTGTVTFLLTDLEGSTRLWEAHPEWMPGAVQRHFEILRRAIEAGGGRIFKTQGDAVAAAFRTAPEALDAAVEAQRALVREEWGGPQRLAVRMALHTGAPFTDGGEYGGPAVHRAHRLLATGHGGQILLCRATQALVRDALGGGLELLDLGEHRLRDLNRTERIFQVLHPELPGRFPPLRALGARPSNLPPERTPLLGRERELGSSTGCCWSAARRC